MRLTWFWLLGLAALASSGCSTLDQIQAGICGNGIVEPGEDCDGSGHNCGAPNSDHPCRFICQTQADCPAHYYCGSDGVCREPTGTFSPQASIPADQEVSFSVADVDGDGNDDIIGINQDKWLSVDYLGASGLLASTGDSSTALPFAVGQLISGDTRADIVHLPGGQVSVLAGQANRTLLPEAYAGISLPPNPVLFIMDAIDVAPDVTPASIAYQTFGGDEIMGLVGNKVVSPLKPGDSTLFPVAESVSALAPRLLSGQIPIGRFDQGLPCQQFVLADQGSSYVSTYSPCTGPGSTAWNTNAAFDHDKITLPAGAAVSDGVMVANLNADPYPDLVIAAGTTGKGTNLYAAYGVGDGTFSSSTPPPAANGDSKASLVFQGAPGLPLAAGDLNGDGIDDFVFSTGVVESRTTGTCEAGFPRPWCDPVMGNQSWTHAAIADLNDDGKPDIIAVSEGARYLEFYGGTGGAAFNESDIPADGYPVALQVGDYDGDGVNDVAVVVANNGNACSMADNKRADSVSVMFGSAHKPPAAPVSEGTLGCVSEVTAGNLFIAGVDSAEELMALSTTSGGQQTAALFRGSTSRDLYAPFLLLPPSTPGLNQTSSLTATADIAIAPQVGAFEGHGSRDIALLAFKADLAREPRLWLLHATGDAELTPYQGPVLKQSDLPIDVCTVLTTHADLDGSGQDEFVLLGRPLIGNGLIAIAKFDSKTQQFTIVQRSPVTSVVLNQPSISRYICSALRNPLKREAPDFSDGTQVHVVNLHGDAKQEIMVLGPKPHALSEHVLRVFAWAGAGQPISDSPVTLPATRPDGKPFDPLGFAVITHTADSAPEIVFATADAAYVGDLDAASLTVGSLTRVGNLAPLDAATLGVGIGGVLGVASGDFNGDHIPDFVVGSQSRFDLFYGVPRAP